MHPRWRAFTLAIAAAMPSYAAAQKPTALRDVWHLEVGKSELHAPRALAVAGDCTLWFADAVAGVFRLGCTARTAQLAGGLAAGAAEYHEPWLLARAGGDSILVYDRNLERLLTYAGDGKFASSTPMRLSATAFAEVTALNVADGTLRAWMTHFPSAADPDALNSLVVRIHAGGTLRDTLATLEGVSSVYWGSTFSGSHIPVPAARRALVAFARDGGFFVGYTNDDRVVLHDADGRVVRTLTLGIPAAGAVTKSDRDAYGDSVRALADREMALLHYNEPERRQYRAQIDTYVKEDAPFPAQRQRYDRLVLDAGERSLWVLLPGAGKNYARTWEVYSTADGSFERRVTVPHKGAVIDAAVKDGILYTVEQPLGGNGRVAKYSQ